MKTACPEEVAWMRLVCLEVIPNEPFNEATAAEGGYTRRLNKLGGIQLDEPAPKGRLPTANGNGTSRNTASPTPEQPPPLPSEWDVEVAKALSEADPLKRSDAVWAILRTKAAVIAGSDRRLAEQRTAVKAIAKDLCLNLTNHEAETILIEADAEVSCYEPVVDPGAEFITSAQQWLLHELILVGLNMLVGMPGAGKSRLLVALVRAFLHGQQTFLQRDLLDGSGRNVLIIGTDQDRQQWGELLAEQGLAVVVERVVVDGIEKVRYRNHAQITLHTSGGGFRLDADGMRYIRRWAQEHPGGLIIIDSLSAVLPPGVSEGDETAGRLMRQIEVARQGLASVVTHHTSNPLRQQSCRVIRTAHQGALP